jgi:DNA-binding YbaB/EbfC family protein
MLDDIQNLLKNANLSNLTSNFSQMQEQIKSVEASGESGAGMVRVTLNGNHKCTNLELSDDLFNEEKNVITDLITSAINQANNNVKQTLGKSFIDSNK